MINCKKCGKETVNKKFCSRSCSASFNNKGVRRHGNTPTPCLLCGKQTKRNKSKYCSIKCHKYFEYQQYIERWLNGDETGIIEKTTDITVSMYVRRWLAERSGNKCEKCDWNEINTQTNKVPLQVHHKDGNSLNTTPDNLEHICPNCHSLTSTYGGLNKGNGRKNRYKKVL